MLTIVNIDQIDCINRDVSVDQIDGADGCEQVIRDVAGVAVFYAGNSDCLAIIPVVAVEGQCGSAEPGLTGVTQAEINGDRINR